MKLYRVVPVMKFSFPSDMLRYDSADFATPIERMKAENPQFNFPGYYVELKSKYKPTHARWRSFGWRVLD